jgi:hypothetical protein
MSDNLRSSCRITIVVLISAISVSVCGRGEAEALTLSSSGPLASGETPGSSISVHVAAENDDTAAVKLEMKGSVFVGET